MLKRRGSRIIAAGFVSPAAVESQAFRGLRVRPLVILGGLEDGLARGELSSALLSSGGRVEQIDGADRAFVRNLPQVGKAVAAWLKGLPIPDVR